MTSMFLPVWPIKPHLKHSAYLQSPKIHIPVNKSMTRPITAIPQFLVPTSILVRVLLLWRNTMSKAMLICTVFNWALAYRFRGSVPDGKNCTERSIRMPKQTSWIYHLACQQSWPCHEVFIDTPEVRSQRASKTAEHWRLLAGDIPRGASFCVPHLP